jgi:hypothetical protein
MDSWKVERWGAEIFSKKSFGSQEMSMLNSGMQDVSGMQHSLSNLIARLAILEDENEEVTEENATLREQIQLLQAENFQRGEEAARRNALISRLKSRIKTSNALSRKTFQLSDFFVCAGCPDKRFFTVDGPLPPFWQKVASKSRTGEFTFKNSQTGERISEKEVSAKMRAARTLR